MATDLTQIETLYYNGFTFPKETYIEVSATPQEDQAGWTVSFVRHQLRAKGVIAETDGLSETEQNAVWEDIRQRLTTYGAALRFYNGGFGDLNINELASGAEEDLPEGVSQPVQDVKWGPKPKIITWNPLGVRGCEFEWVVETCIPECDDAVYTGKLMAFNYTINLRRDIQGYTTRTLSGYIEIPITRDPDNPRVPPDNADRYWEQVAPRTPFGYTLLSNDATISEDGTRLNFSVQHGELKDGFYLPPGATTGTINHSIQVAGPASARHVATIRANYSLANNLEKSQALYHFANLVIDRLQAQRAKGSQAFLPISINVEHSLLDRTAGSFSFTYSYVVGITDPRDAFAKIPDGSQLWRKTGNYQAWVRSMHLAHGPRGTAGYRVSPADYRIIDLCDQTNATPVTGFTIPLPPLEGEFGRPGITLPPIPPEYSLLRYNVVVRIFSETGSVFTKTLPPANSTPKEITPISGIDGSGFSIGGAETYSRGGEYLSGVGAGFVLGGLGRPGNTFTSSQSGGTPQGGPGGGSGSGGGLAGGSGTGGAGTPLVNEFSRTQPTVYAMLHYDIASVMHRPSVPRLHRIGTVGPSAISFLSGDDSRQEIGNFFGSIAYRIFGWSSYILKVAPGVLPEFPENFFTRGTDGKILNKNGGYSSLHL